MSDRIEDLISFTENRDGSVSIGLTRPGSGVPGPLLRAVSAYIEAEVSRQVRLAVLGPERPFRQPRRATWFGPDDVL